MIKGKLTPQELAEYLRSCNDGEIWLLVCTILFEQHESIKAMQDALGLNDVQEESELDEPVKVEKLEYLEATKRKR